MKILTFLVIFKPIWFLQIYVILDKCLQRSSAISFIAQENILTQEGTMSVESSPSYTSSTFTTTQSPDECKLKGHCDTIGSFLSLGDCLNCYCQCAYNTSTSAQWTKNCCNPGEVWNPNAWPNPDSCDNPKQMEICAENSVPTQEKFNILLISLTMTLIIYLNYNVYDV